MLQWSIATVLHIPDLHEPHSHERAYEFLEQVYKDYKCDKIVCAGDEVDLHTLSRFPKHYLSPGQDSEIHQALKGLEDLKKIFQAKEISFCVSNHTSRPFRVAELMGLSRYFLKEYREWLEAPPEWTWYYDGELIVDNVMYIHGDHYSGQYGHIKAAMKNRRSTVIGHIHAHAGVQYLNGWGKDNQIFGLNGGCLIGESWAFDYARKQPDKPTIGCSIIQNGHSGIFIPMRTYYEDV